MLVLYGQYARSSALDLEGHLVNFMFVHPHKATIYQANNPSPIFSAYTRDIQSLIRTIELWAMCFVDFSEF